MVVCFSFPSLLALLAPPLLSFGVGCAACQHLFFFSVRSVFVCCLGFPLHLLRWTRPVIGHSPAQGVCGSDLWQWLPAVLAARRDALRGSGCGASPLTQRTIAVEVQSSAAGGCGWAVGTGARAPEMQNRGSARPPLPPAPSPPPTISTARRRQCSHRFQLVRRPPPPLPPPANGPFPISPLLSSASVISISWLAPPQPPLLVD